MTPKIEWCNWVFDYTDSMDTNRWMVKRDCCDDEILLIRGDSKNWKAYQASLKPYPVRGCPDAVSMCPNCGKFVNGVNPHVRFITLIALLINQRLKLSRRRTCYDKQWLLP